MSRPGPFGWLRDRSPLELASLAAAAVVMGWLGWDLALWDPRQQALLHLVAALVIGGVTVAAFRGAALPHTPLDLPILALLAAFAAATASAMNVGMSLRAMASIVVAAALLPILLVAVRHRPSWVGVLASVPVLALAIPTLAYLVARRLDWIVAGAPGLPPLRLLNEGTPFGSVAVPPFVIWPAWALAGLVQPPAWRRRIRTGLVAVGIPLTLLSGSRSAWLAIGLTVMVAAAPWAWRRRHRLRLPERIGLRELLMLGAGLVLAAGAAAIVVPRLTAVTSLLYRAGLWRDTLAAWSADPLLGVGPGFMPYARQAAAPDFSFPVRQPHSHNLPLGVLGDAGLVGLAAAVVVVVTLAVVAGPWRSRTATGRSAALVLIGLGIGGLFEDLTFLPNFVVLGAALAAVALTDAGAVRWVSPASWGTAQRLAAAAGTLAIAAAMTPAVALGDASAITHRAGIDAWERGDPETARDELVRAVALDRWHPAPPKALAVAAAAAGDPDLARRAADLAVSRNPGDAPSWANLALLCADADDIPCAERAAERAAARAPFLGLELANAALVLEEIGRPVAADDAYVRSLLSQRLTAFGLTWSRPIEIEQGAVGEDFGALSDLNLLLAGWAAGDRAEPATIADPAVRALAHAQRGERSAAEPLLAEAIEARPDDPLPWQLAIVLRDAWGEPIDEELRAWRSLTGRPFPARDEVPTRPVRSDDIASFRSFPGDELVDRAERLETDPIWPWILVEMLP
ncbi:MAG TPA: O-antigen ligase family protein [Candidatus Angelobacter sp.]|nr:O-antigen ligase family protein [Candidatus Angelobacter sp.]